MTKIKFNNANEMYEYIKDGNDLWNPDKSIYVFVYNDNGSICVYDNITSELAKSLDKGEEYWGAYLGWQGSSIYDGEDVLRWCEYMYDTEWVDVTK